MQSILIVLVKPTLIVTNLMVAKIKSQVVAPKVGNASWVSTSSSRVSSIWMKDSSMPYLRRNEDQMCTPHWCMTPHHIWCAWVTYKKCLRMYYVGRHGVGSLPPLGMTWCSLNNELLHGTCMRMVLWASWDECLKIFVWGNSKTVSSGASVCGHYTLSLGLKVVIWYEFQHNILNKYDMDVSVVMPQ